MILVSRAVNDRQRDRIDARKGEGRRRDLVDDNATVVRTARVNVRNGDRDRCRDESCGESGLTRSNRVDHILYSDLRSAGCGVCTGVLHGHEDRDWRDTDVGT